MTLNLDERQRAMLQEMGVQVWLPQTQTQTQFDPPMSDVPSAPLAVAKNALSPPAAVSAAMPPLHALDWSALRQAAALCEACVLCKGRKQTTLQPLHAVSQAHWLVVGDPPDEDEDRLGRPFAESAGVLLDNMLRAVGASRDGAGAAGAHVSNVVKCRPPHGHLPQPEELVQCSSYLQREIALVQPKVILAMGRYAVNLLLRETPELANQPLGKLRGTVYRYQGIPVVVTYHPKVLLRASADKAKAWADLCLAMDVMQSTYN